MLNDRRVQIGVAVAVVVAIALVLWPSTNVRNLESRGTAVIAFGDSLTAGVGASDGNDYVSRVASQTGLDIANAGVSGDTTEDALARIERDVLARDPRIVIVGLGGNDFLRQVPMATTEANLRTIVRQIQDAGAMVVLLGFSFPSFGPRYEDMYEKVAEDTGCLLVPDVLDGILNNPKLKSDEIHPNADGYALLAERVAGPLAKLKERADANRSGS
ncbi:MAG TPA: arylesterase [Thermoanaerobaculia bacterium]|jgi:acyl-CoA thioesterase-1|nr:arylesterase [Thermoanaerobaculia bacterium]